MTSTFSAAVCEMEWDSSTSQTKDTSKSVACTSFLPAPAVIRSLSAAPTIKTDCEPGFTVSFSIGVVHADEAAATTYTNGLAAKVTPFNSVTYLEDNLGVKLVSQTASTTVAARPAAKVCNPAAETPAATPAADGTSTPGADGASTLTTVAGALALAAMF